VQPPGGKRLERTSLQEHVKGEPPKVERKGSPKKKRLGCQEEVGEERGCWVSNGPPFKRLQQKLKIPKYHPRQETGLALEGGTKKQKNESSLDGPHIRKNQKQHQKKTRK